MWRKKKSNPEALERLERADQAIIKSEEDSVHTQELRTVIGDAMAYLAKLNQENSFAVKMERAYAARGSK
jgi:hypothetical protein